MTKQKVETKKVEKKKKMAIMMFARDGKEENEIVCDYCITGDIPKMKAIWMLAALTVKLGDLAENVTTTFADSRREVINDPTP